MCQCVQCGKELDDWNTIIINVDGDGVCSEECQKQHALNMDKFCTEILPDDTKFAEWLGVPVKMVRRRK